MSKKQDLQEKAEAYNYGFEAGKLAGKKELVEAWDKKFSEWDYPSVRKWLKSEVEK